MTPRPLLAVRLVGIAFALVLIVCAIASAHRIVAPVVLGHLHAHDPAASVPAGTTAWDTQSFTGIAIPDALHPAPGALVLLNIRADFSTHLCVGPRCGATPQQPVYARLIRQFANPFALLPSLLLILLALPLVSNRALDRLLAHKMATRRNAAPATRRSLHS